VKGGQGVTLSVTATGTPAPTYQWQRNGADIAGATDATLTIGAAQESDAGNYQVVIKNAAGAATSSAGAVTVNTSRIINLSIRSTLSAAAPSLTMGFVVSGNQKPLLLRGVGPGLTQFGVGGVLKDPKLEFYAGSKLVTSNDNWSSATNATQIAATATQVGAFPLPTGSADAALTTTLDSGNYSAQISGADGGFGGMLVELYDGGGTTGARLTNVSAHTLVDTPNGGLAAGFVIGGSGKKTLLIRAVGPSLATFGLSGLLADPKLEVLRSGSTTAQASNDNWGDGDSEKLKAAFTAVGAFPLLAASRDAVLLVELDPGAYTAQVTGVSNTSGDALIEIYEVP